jgi:hypothetical protein
LLCASGLTAVWGSGCMNMLLPVTHWPPEAFNKPVLYLLLMSQSLDELALRLGAHALVYFCDSLNACFVLVEPQFLITLNFTAM